MKEIDREEYVRQIRAIGESLIKNAESIVGNEKYLKSIYISVNIDPYEDAPMIDVSKSFVPERLVYL